MNVLVLLATLSLAPSLAAATQESVTLGSLNRARAVFDRIDADGDESLSAEESESIGIPAEHFKDHDSDRDQCVSRDEFSIYYYYLLLTAAEGVEVDLVDEVARIRALHLAQQPILAGTGPDPAGRNGATAGKPAKTGSKMASKATTQPKPTRPSKGEQHSRESLAQARRLLVRLSEEGALSKPVTHDFRSFFWGREPRNLPLSDAVPALVRANAEIDEMIAAEALNLKQASLLRRTLANRAGPTATRAAIEAGIRMMGPDSDGQTIVGEAPEIQLPSVGPRQSVPVGVSEFDVSVTGLDDETNPEDFVGPRLQGDQLAPHHSAQALSDALTSSVPVVLGLTLSQTVASDWSHFVESQDADAGSPMGPRPWESVPDTHSVEEAQQEDLSGEDLDVLPLEMGTELERLPLDLSSEATETEAPAPLQETDPGVEPDSGDSGFEDGFGDDFEMAETPPISVVIPAVESDPSVPLDVSSAPMIDDVAAPLEGPQERRTKKKATKGSAGIDLLDVQVAVKKVHSGSDVVDGAQPVAVLPAYARSVPPIDPTGGGQGVAPAMPASSSDAP